MTLASWWQSWKMPVGIRALIVSCNAVCEASSLFHANAETGNGNASEIEATAAEHGYGPLLYDIAMSMEGGLIPDRSSVSAAARRVWSFYMSDREDVVAKELDDEMDPHTQPVVDDTYHLYPGGANNPLNHAYFIKRAPATTALFTNHEAVLRRVGRRMKKDDWLGLGQDYFDRKY